MNTKQTSNLEKVRELLIIWRGYTGEQVAIPSDEESLEGYGGLLSFFEEKLNSNIDRWKRFALYVCGSKQLTNAIMSCDKSLKFIMQDQIFSELIQGVYHTEGEHKKYGQQFNMGAA